MKIPVRGDTHRSGLVRWYQTGQIHRRQVNTMDVAAARSCVWTHRCDVPLRNTGDEFFVGIEKEAFANGNCICADTVA